MWLGHFLPQRDTSDTFSLVYRPSFPVAIPMRTYTAVETAQGLLSIISCFGAPLAILSDQGSTFLSTTLSLLYQKLQIARIKTRPYRPQSNGTLERFHATLKSMLRKTIDNQQHDWDMALDLVLHYARNIPHSRAGHTPFELTFAKPTLFIILHTLKTLWTGGTNNSVIVPQFIADVDTHLAAQAAAVKESLKSKVSKQRLSLEKSTIAHFKVGDCGGIGRRLRWRLSFLGRQPDPGGMLPPESRWLLLRLKLSGPFMALGSPQLVYAIADPRGQSLNSIS